jgi:hypothetical protein
MQWAQSLRSKVKDIDNCAFPYIITKVIWCCRLHYTPTLRSLCGISCFGLHREVTLCEVPSNNFPLLPQAEMIRVTPHSEALHNTMRQQNLFLSSFLWYPVIITRKKQEKKRWGDLKKWSTHPFWRGKIPFKNAFVPALRWDKEKCKGPYSICTDSTGFHVVLSGILICLTDLLVWTPCLMHRCVCIWRYILQNYNYKLHSKNLSTYHILHVSIRTLAAENLDVCTACDPWDSNIQLTMVKDRRPGPGMPFLDVTHSQRGGGGGYLFMPGFSSLYMPSMDGWWDGWMEKDSRPRRPLLYVTLDYDLPPTNVLG